MVLPILEAMREVVPSPLDGHNALLFYLPRNIIKVAYHLVLSLKIAFNQCVVLLILLMVKDDSYRDEHF